MPDPPEDPRAASASGHGVNDEEEAAREREERSAILRRRAVFVASAIAGLTLPGACGDPRPQACLSEVPLPTPLSAISSTSADAGPESDAGVEDAGVPRPCLSEAPDPARSVPPLKGRPAPPQPCLDMPAPQVCLEMPPLPPPPPRPKPCLNK